MNNTPTTHTTSTELPRNVFIGCSQVSPHISNPVHTLNIIVARSFHSQAAPCIKIGDAWSMNLQGWSQRASSFPLCGACRCNTLSYACSPVYPSLHSLPSLSFSSLHSSFGPFILGPSCFLLGIVSYTHGPFLPASTTSRTSAPVPTRHRTACSTSSPIDTSLTTPDRPLSSNMPPPACSTTSPSTPNMPREPCT
jgi:hypothetical protein